MKGNGDISICLVIVFVALLVFIGVWMQAWGEISWKEQQLQEKFNNINMSDYTSYEKQMEKVKRTQDYLKYWGWR